MWPTKAPRVATVHDNYQRVELGPRYPSAPLPHVCLSGHTMGGPCSTLVTPLRYGRVLSNLAIDEASKFVGLKKILYALVHNLKLVHSDSTNAGLSQHKRGLPPWSSEFQIRPLPFLPIQYSPFSPNCPTRSSVMPTIRSSR
jgi:hypothetical protein